MSIDRKDWINRCAERLVKNQGYDQSMAKLHAETLANDEAALNGSSGAAWRSPEDVADDDAELS